MNKIVSRNIHIRRYKSSLQVTISQFGKAEKGWPKCERIHTFDNPSKASLKRLTKVMTSPFLETTGCFLEPEYQAHYYHLPKLYPVKATTNLADPALYEHDWQVDAQGNYIHERP